MGGGGGCPGDGTGLLLETMTGADRSVQPEVLLTVLAWA